MTLKIKKPACLCKKGSVFFFFFFFSKKAKFELILLKACLTLDFRKMSTYFTCRPISTEFFLNDRLFTLKNNIPYKMIVLFYRLTRPLCPGNYYDAIHSYVLLSKCNPGWFYGGLFLIPLPSWEAKGYDTFMFRGPATSLRLPLTHSELSLETIKNPCCLEVYWELLQYYRINRRSGL